MPNVFKKEDMLTVTQFAERIGMSRRFVYNLIDKGPTEGGISAFRFGGVKGLRVPVREVERIKQQSAVVGG